jgi:hypothetical protein
MEAEEASAELEAKLNDPGFQAAHYQTIPDFIQELEASKSATAALYARWEELEELAKREI